MIRISLGSLVDLATNRNQNQNNWYKEKKESFSYLDKKYVDGQDIGVCT